MKERRSIPTPLCKRAGSGHRKEVIVARIDQDRLLSQRNESLAPKEARSRDILVVSQNFVHGLNEHFGHHVVPLALRNVIAFEANAWLHERLKCFAVQASIATKQHVLKFQRIVPSP